MLLPGATQGGAAAAGGALPRPPPHWGAQLQGCAAPRELLQGRGWLEPAPQEGKGKAAPPLRHFEEGAQWWGDGCHTSPSLWFTAPSSLNAKPLPQQRHGVGAVSSTAPLISTSLLPERAAAPAACAASQPLPPRLFRGRKGPGSSSPSLACHRPPRHHRVEVLLPGSAGAEPCTPPRGHVLTPAATAAPRGAPHCMWVERFGFSSLEMGQKEGGKRAATGAAGSTTTGEGKRTWELFSAPRWLPLAPRARAAGACSPPSEAGASQDTGLQPQPGLCRQLLFV